MDTLTLGDGNQFHGPLPNTWGNMSQARPHYTSSLVLVRLHLATFLHKVILSWLQTFHHGMHKVL